jgi:hypothetical protein
LRTNIMFENYPLSKLKVTGARGKTFPKAMKNS